MRILLLVLLIVHTMAGIVCAADDWGYSHNFLIRKKMNERWSIVSRSLFSSREDMRDVFFGVVDLGFDYDVKDWLRAGMAYRGAWFRMNQGFEYENRPLINVQFHKNVKGYYLSNRHRFEFRYYNDSREDDIRYRNETWIVFPYEIIKFKLRP